MVPTPVALPPTQPARDGGQAARGGVQVIRGGGHPVRGLPRGGRRSGGAQPYFYAFPARSELKFREKNYLVHDLELIAIVEAMRIWRCYPYGVPCDVYTSESPVPVQVERPQFAATEMSSLLESIKARQIDDPHLLVLKDTVQQGGAKKVVIGDDGVMQLQGQICVPNIDGLRELILEKAHNSPYSIHPGVTKMYHDLKQHYWWQIMKKVKYEHQKSGGLTQRLESASL
uniref:Uncharacterized protein LOC104246665 n=1 Tax=Nicotiana sylvestris TaxID=4096 RepID=A0A1U7YPR7_NICSY|nr:PREDICTED: uncharacterized protein LOC104246665 [Nicotiana sylvestris]